MIGHGYFVIKHLHLAAVVVFICCGHPRCDSYLNHTVAHLGKVDILYRRCSFVPIIVSSCRISCTNSFEQHRFLFLAFNLWCPSLLHSFQFRLSLLRMTFDITAYVCDYMAMLMRVRMRVRVCESDEWFGAKFLFVYDCRWKFYFRVKCETQDGRVVFTRFIFLSHSFYACSSLIKFRCAFFDFVARTRHPSKISNVRASCDNVPCIKTWIRQYYLYRLHLARRPPVVTFIITAQYDFTFCLVKCFRTTPNCCEYKFMRYFELQTLIKQIKVGPNHWVWWRRSASAKSHNRIICECWHWPAVVCGVCWQTGSCVSMYLCVCVWVCRQITAKYMYKYVFLMAKQARESNKISNLIQFVGSI